MESSHSVMSPPGGAGMRRASTQPALHESLMAMLETLACSIIVNRPVRTRTLGGVGAGG